MNKDMLLDFEMAREAITGKSFYDSGKIAGVSAEICSRRVRKICRKAIRFVGIGHFEIEFYKGMFCFADYRDINSARAEKEKWIKILEQYQNGLENND